MTELPARQRFNPNGSASWRHLREDREKLKEMRALLRTLPKGSIKSLMVQERIAELTGGL